MGRYVPSSCNAARIFGAPDTIFHPGFWQAHFIKELHEVDNIAPYAPTITSPNGGENIGTRYFTITWNEAVPTDPNSPDGDYVHYIIEYSTDAGGSWSQAYDNSGFPLNNVQEGTTSAVWDLGSIPDSMHALIKICAYDSYGAGPSCDISNSQFTISGGTCF